MDNQTLFNSVHHRGTDTFILEGKGSFYAALTADLTADLIDYTVSKGYSDYLPTLCVTLLLI